MRLKARHDSFAAYIRLTKARWQVDRSFAPGGISMWIAKLFTARALLCVGALPLAIGLSACPYVAAPRHDYPSEYPVAEPIGQCANLNGTFENAGTELNKSQPASAPTDAILLSTFILAPGVIASDRQASALRISGPASGLLEIEALSADGTLAHASLPSAREVYGFVHSKPFSSFVCAGGQVLIVNDPVTGPTKHSSYEVVVKLYRAKDGSLIVARERVYPDFVYGVDVVREWIRFQRVSVKPPA